MVRSLRFRVGQGFILCGSLIDNMSSMKCDVDYERMTRTMTLKT